MGFLYRIFLSRTLGSEGLGIYHVAISVFSVLFTITCSGVPATISRLITKYNVTNEKEKKHRLVSSGIILALLISGGIAIIFYLFKTPLSFIFSDKRCTPIFLWLLPGLIFTSVYAVMRGWFWGEKNFLPYSIIELIEEIFMIILGVVLISRMTSVYDGAKRAAMAMSFSFILSCIFACAYYFIKGGRLKTPKKEMKALLKSSAPISAMRTASSLIGSLVAIILPLRLTAVGFTKSQALSAFGTICGMAMPILSLPSSIISSLALVLVPELAEYFYKERHKEMKSTIEKAIKFSSYLACLLLPVYFACGKEIGLIIYGNLDAGKCIAISGILMLPMSLTLITNSMLNSLNKEKNTLCHYFIGAIGTFFSIIFLPKFLGIYALLIGHFLSYSTITILNLRLLKKHCKKRVRYKKFVALCLAISLPSAILGKLFINVLSFAMPLAFALILSVIVTSISFILLCIIFNVFNVSHFKKLKRKKLATN